VAQPTLGNRLVSYNYPATCVATLFGGPVPHRLVELAALGPFRRCLR